MNLEKYKKIAFVSSGGGVSCAYGAGVAWALHESGIKPQIVIGASGSAGTVSYLVCGQAPFAARQLWNEEVVTADLLKFHPLRFDVDYLVDSMRDRFTFDEQKLRSPEVELYLAVTAARSAQLKFFSNHDMVDWYEVIRASMALPIVYGKQINLAGDLYYDGEIAHSVHDYTRWAAARGADLIFVCDNSVRWSLDMLHMLEWNFLKHYRDMTRSLRGQIKKLSPFHPAINGVKIVYITPTASLLTGLFNHDRAAVTQAIELGYHDFSQINLKEL